mmetsp:Transcript_4720/g.11099  ORF Transcript_4720/g.11099 Transcript_4720/m.11099 type:complete len:574 (+) Transcript_4720:53-1774(+)
MPLPLERTPTASLDHGYTDGGRGSADPFADGSPRRKRWQHQFRRKKLQSIVATQILAVTLVVMLWGPTASLLPRLRAAIPGTARSTVSQLHFGNAFRPVTRRISHFPRMNYVFAFNSRNAINSLGNPLRSAKFCHVGAQLGTNWSALGIDSPQLENSLSSRLQISNPNELQIRSAKPILSGEDVILSSYPGSGKTLAALVPLITRIGKLDVQCDSPQDGTCCPVLLVVTPTRELNFQFLRVLESLLHGTPKLTSLGESETQQHVSKNSLDALHIDRDPNIVVATPKELLLWLNKGALALSNLHALVLDEVDMLVDTDLARLRRLFKYLPLPEERKIQKVLASASALAHPDMEKLMKDLSMDKYETFGSVLPFNSADNESGGSGDMALSPTLKHAILEIRDDEGKWASTTKNPENAFGEKFSLLLQILDSRRSTCPNESTLIFVHKKSKSTRELLESLRRRGVDAELLSSTRRIQRRNVATLNLIEGSGCVVVATDELAARGLDYEAVSMVINFDLPFGVKNYLHRAGRTGRAGRAGIVLSMISNEKESRFLTQKIFGSLKGVKLGDYNISNSS